MRCESHRTWTTAERCPNEATYRLTITIPSVYAPNEPSGQTGSITFTRAACREHAEQCKASGIGDVTLEPLTTR